MTDFPALSPETIAQAREMYDAATPNADLREFLGMTERQFLAFRKAQGWPLRDRFAVPPRRAPRWAREDCEPPLESLTQEELIARMEAAVAREFLCAERDRQNGRQGSARAHTRTMANLVKMLGDLTRLRRGGKADAAEPEHQTPTRDLQQLREELARRLERMAREEDADMIAR